MKKRLQMQKQPMEIEKIARLEAENRALRRDFNALVNNVQYLGNLAAILTEFRLAISRVDQAVALSDGERRSKIVKSHSGVLIGLAKQYLDLFQAMNRTQVISPEVQEVLDLAEQYEKGINAVMVTGSYELLRQAAESSPFMATKLFYALAQSAIRGSRPKEERTYLLGEIVADVHKPGQSRLTTARMVIERLTPLTNRYHWVQGDITTLQSAIDQSDSDRAWDLLKYPYAQWKKYNWRAGG